MDSAGKYLGSASFRQSYELEYAYVAGAMYRGIASKELVVAMGRAGMMSYLGTGGLALNEVASNVDFIQSQLTSNEPYGANLLHQPDRLDFEMRTVELYLTKGVKRIEAAAYMQITEALAYFHVSGFTKTSDGRWINLHQIMGKVSRPEVAELFMSPVSDRLLDKLLQKSKVSPEQAEIARKYPIACAICVEADSGGHTDRGVAMTLFPSIAQLRIKMQNKYSYTEDIHIGLAGGLGSPQAIACAFTMGADFVVTGSINQCTVESGASDGVKDLLQDIDVQDTAYAPAGDMFEIGAKVQVLKKGLLFAARANKLYELYGRYDSLEDIPVQMRSTLEKKYFKKSLESVWADVEEHLRSEAREVELNAIANNPKSKMSAVFRWYFAYSTKAAFKGNIDDKVDFQVHTGPALGSFNQWVKGTELESWRNRHVDLIGKKLMEEGADSIVALSNLVTLQSSSPVSASNLNT